MQRHGGSEQPVKGRRHRATKPKARKASSARVSATDLEEQVATLTRELKEAREQQTATSEVLQVISSSAGELAPVFESLLASAKHLCDAEFGIIFLREGDAFRTVALHGATAEYTEARWRAPFIRPAPDTGLGRVLKTKQVVQIADVRAVAGYVDNPVQAPIVQLAGVRSKLTVPMLKDEDLIGVIEIDRREVRPFTDRQIALLENFAAQAVIAIENTRLLNELRESLQQQTATADVLKVISSSPGELEPVFNAMLENAVRICGAHFGNLALYDGSQMRMAAMYNPPREYEAVRRTDPIVPLDRSVLGVIVRTKGVTHISDMTADDPYASWPLVKIAGARAVLGVPMMREGDLVGAIVIYRTEPVAFNEKQIGLLTNFAAQAVIAIENTRLLNELRQRTDDLSESLEQQTATLEVLQVISSSPGQLETVFDAMLANATRICGAKIGALYVREGDGYRVVGATHDAPPAFVEARKHHTRLQPPPDGPLGRVASTKQIVHIADIKELQSYLVERHPVIVAAVELGGFRTALAVPMLQDDQLVGAITIMRQEVLPFTEKQIELVKNFAAQAVVAIENARLLNELRQRTDDLSKSLEDLRVTQDRLVQTQKLALLGQLTAGIAHEIKNPLNFVNNFSGISAELIDELQATLKGISVDDKTRTEINELTDTLKSNFDKVVHHGRRADAIVKNMLQHSREGSGEHRVVDINALVEESLNLAWHGARAETQGFEIKLKQSFDPSAGEADVFPQDIRRALLNMISNGFYAAIKRGAAINGGDYEPILTASTKTLGDRVEIRIRDNGTGMTPDVKEKMFNPFFTTKPTGEGTGLGLSISHDIIVKQHGGSIEVETQPGEFTEIRIILPRTTVFV
jgi:GAF domain-containing protein